MFKILGLYFDILQAFDNDWYLVIRKMIKKDVNKDGNIHKQQNITQVDKKTVNHQANVQWPQKREEEVIQNGQKILRQKITEPHEALRKDGLTDLQ